MPKGTSVLIDQKTQSVRVTFDQQQQLNYPLDFLREHLEKESLGAYEQKDTQSNRLESVTLKEITPVSDQGLVLEFGDGYRSCVLSWDKLLELATGLEEK